MLTLVEGNPKAPFSIVTTPRSRGECYSFPGLLHFTLDPYLIMLSVKQGGIKYHFFESLVWFDLGLNPGLPDHWWTLYSLGQYIWINKMSTNYFLYIKIKKNKVFYCIQSVDLKSGWWVPGTCTDLICVYQGFKNILWGDAMEQSI